MAPTAERGAGSSVLINGLPFFQGGATYLSHVNLARMDRERYARDVELRRGWRLADAVGRCSLAGDSERPAPWNLCVPAEDRGSGSRVDRAG